MNDLKRIAFFQRRRPMGLAGNDIPVEFDDHASGPDLQLLEKPSDAKPVGDLFFFSVNMNLHFNKKTVFATTALAVAREYGFKLVPMTGA